MKLHKSLLQLDPFVLQTIASDAQNTGLSMGPRFAAASELMPVDLYTSPAKLFGHSVNVDLSQRPAGLAHEK